MLPAANHYLNQNITYPPLYTDNPFGLVVQDLNEGHIVALYNAIEPCLIFYASANGEKTLESLKTRQLIHIDCHCFDEKFPEGTWETDLRKAVNGIYIIASDSLTGRAITGFTFPNQATYIYYPIDEDAPQ